MEKRKEAEAEAEEKQQKKGRSAGEQETGSCNWTAAALVVFVWQGFLGERQANKETEWLSEQKALSKAMSDVMLLCLRLLDHRRSAEAEHSHLKFGCLPVFFSLSLLFLSPSAPFPSAASFFSLFLSAQSARPRSTPLQSSEWRFQTRNVKGHREERGSGR